MTSQHGQLPQRSTDLAVFPMSGLVRFLLRLDRPYQKEPGMKTSRGHLSAPITSWQSLPPCKMRSSCSCVKYPVWLWGSTGHNFSSFFFLSIAVFSCGRECQRGRTKSALLLGCPQGLVYVGTCGMFGGTYRRGSRKQRARWCGSHGVVKRSADDLVFLQHGEW